MQMSEQIVYPRLNPSDLEPHYCRHISAMTSEGLHEKSDIAIQLAWRDKRIAELEAEVAALSRDEQTPVDAKQVPLEELRHIVGARVLNCLANAGVVTLGQIRDLSEEDLLKIKNFGATSLAELKTAMTAWGLPGPRTGARGQGDLSRFSKKDEVLRLRAEGKSLPEIARSVGYSATTVRLILRDGGDAK
jgi:hypothetical protein